MIAAGSHYCDIQLVVLSMRLLLVRLTMLELPLNFPTMSLWMVLKPPSRHSVEYGNTKDEFSTRLFQKTESVSVPMPCADRKLRICRRFFPAKVCIQVIQAMATSQFQALKFVVFKVSCQILCLTTGA